MQKITFEIRELQIQEIQHFYKVYEQTIKTHKHQRILLAY